MSNDQLKIRHRLSAVLLPLTTLIVFLTIWYLYAKFNYDNPVQR